MSREREPEPGVHDAAAQRTWLRPGEVLFVSACVLVLGFLVADVLADGLITGLDREVADYVASRGAAAGWMQAATTAGGFGVSGAIVVIATLMSAQRSWRWWPLGLTVGVVATMSVLVVGTKTLVGREGPPGVDTPQGYAGYFPSGHTATSVVCLGTAAFLVMAMWRPGLGVGQAAASRARWRRALTVSRVVGFVAGSVVGAAAVLTGHHWLTDVAAGIALSMAVLVVGTAAARGYLCRPHHRAGRSVGGTP